MRGEGRNKDLDPAINYDLWQNYERWDDIGRKSPG